jgi:hypothetical protein
MIGARTIAGLVPVVLTMAFACTEELETYPEPGNPNAGGSGGAGGGSGGRYPYQHCQPETTCTGYFWCPDNPVPSDADAATTDASFDSATAEASSDAGDEPIPDSGRVDTGVVDSGAVSITCPDLPKGSTFVTIEKRGEQCCCWYTHMSCLP